MKLTLRDFTSDVNTASFNRDATLLATAEESGIARVWNVNTGEEVARFTDFTLPVGRVFFAADQNILAATEVDWSLLDARTSTWDLTTKKMIKRLDHCRMLAVNSEGSKLAAVDQDSKPSVWSLPELNLVASSPELQPEAICARFSTDGNFLAFGTRKADVRIWAADLSAWNSLPRFTADPSVVRDVAFTPDGQFLIVGTDNGTVWTWELTSQTVQKVFRAVSGPVWSVAVSRTTTLFGHRAGIVFLTFSADGRTLASAGEDGEVRLWHVPTAQPICELQGLSGYVHVLQLPAYGRRLIAVANNSNGGSQMLVWDANVPIP